MFFLHKGGTLKKTSCQQKYENIPTIIYLNNQTRFFLCLLQHVFFWNTDAAIEENILNRDQQRLIGKPLNYKTLNSTKKNIWGKNKQLLWTQNLNWSNFTNNWIKLDYQQHEELFYYAQSHSTVTLNYLTTKTQYCSLIKLLSKGNIWREETFKKGRKDWKYTRSAYSHHSKTRTMVRFGKKLSRKLRNYKGHCA